MATYKITSTGSTILADQGFMDAQHPEDYTLLDEPLPPAQPASCPAYDWYRKFTLAEMTAIHALAATDSSVYAFMHVLEMSIAAGADVVSNDPVLIEAMAYLQVTPASAPCLTAARAAQQLSMN
jgi:hypothetical protein